MYIICDANNNNNKPHSNSKHTAACRVHFEHIEQERSVDVNMFYIAYFLFYILFLQSQNVTYNLL